MPTQIVDSQELRVTPMVISEDVEVTLTVSGEYVHTKFIPGVSYNYSLKSLYVVANGTRKKGTIDGTVTGTDTEDVTIRFTPDTTGTWILTIEGGEDTRKHFPITLAIYVMPEELSGYRGYIGELHSHSTSSDGRQMPAYPPMRARTYGYDFFALTDHWCYESSIEMIQIASEAVGASMLLLNGEEMHPEREEYFAKAEEQTHVHHYHYTAIGHTRSVRDEFLLDKSSIQKEIQTIADEMAACVATGVAAGEDSPNVPRGVDSMLDLLPYAEGVWKVRKAKELGGIAVYAHPYWATPINLDRGAIEQTFKDREVDAVEAFSPADPSTYTINRLMMPDLATSPIPVVGVSDSHNWDETVPCKSFTLVMARELSRDAVLDSIRSGRCAACRMSDPVALAGPFDITNFADFYLDHILPKRRRITSLQGNIGLSKLRGGAFSSDLIDKLDGDLAALDNAIWGTAK